VGIVKPEAALPILGIGSQYYTEKVIQNDGIKARTATEVPVKFDDTNSRYPI